MKVEVHYDGKKEDMVEFIKAMVRGYVKTYTTICNDEVATNTDHIDKE